MRYCCWPTCSVLVERGYCRTHARRPNEGTRKLYRTARWARLRQQLLRERAHTCAACGRVEINLDVDHIRPYRDGDDPATFWDPRGLQLLCKPCHRAKTARGE